MRIAQLEDLQRHVAHASALVRQQEARDPAFARLVKDWLDQLERALAPHAPAQSAEVAGVRALVVSAEQGAIPPGLGLRGRPTRTRVLHAVAAGAIPQAAQVVARVLDPAAARVSEAEALVRQVVALGRFRRLIPAPGPALDAGSADARSAVDALWRQIGATEELATAVVRIEGMVGRDDALELLEREIRSG